MPPKKVLYTDHVPVVRVHPRIRERLEESADRMGLSLSDFCRLAYALALEFPGMVKQVQRDSRVMRKLTRKRRARK